MKKIFTHAAMLLMALVAMTSLTSCDSDTMLAYDLEGVWRGEIAQQFYNYRWGRSTDYYETEIHFSQRGGWEAGGTGYELDWNGRSYSRSYFTWTVSNGRIYLDYSDATYTIVIRDFDIYTRGGRQYFNGYFDKERTGETLAAFDLVKVSSPNDYYENRYYYDDPYYDPYYSREKRDSVAATDSVR